MGVMKSGYVTASELAEFVYCECCWMDNLEKPKEANLEMLRGTDEHELLQGTALLLGKLKQVVIYIIIFALALVVSLIIYQMFLGGEF